MNHLMFPSNVCLFIAYVWSRHNIEAVAKLVDATFASGRIGVWIGDLGSVLLLASLSRGLL